jgi:hypothetical protein
MKIVIPIVSRMVTKVQGYEGESVLRTKVTPTKVSSGWNTTNYVHDSTRRIWIPIFPGIGYREEMFHLRHPNSKVIGFRMVRKR